MVSPQAPVASPFGFRTTAAEVVAGIDLTGKTAVVTGGYSGIGTETVRALAGAGAHVIVGARRPDVAQTNLADVTGLITIVPLDLADPSSIDVFAEEVSSRLNRLELLINNAAIKETATRVYRHRTGYQLCGDCQKPDCYAPAATVR